MQWRFDLELCSAVWSSRTGMRQRMATKVGPAFDEMQRGENFGAVLALTLSSQL
jgi:hypothetical protein